MNTVYSTYVVVVVALARNGVLESLPLRQFSITYTPSNPQRNPFSPAAAPDQRFRSEPRSFLLRVGVLTEWLGCKFNHQGRRVADIMDRECPTVEGHLSLQDFVDEYLLRSGHGSYVVVRAGQITGLITAHEVKGVDRERWPQTSVQSAMRPLAQVRTGTPETPSPPGTCDDEP